MVEATEIIIVGTGGNAYDILDVIEACNGGDAQSWRPIGFLDDVKSVGALHCGLPVLGKLEDAARLRKTGRAFVVAIGSERTFRTREALIKSMGLADENFATLVHPAATVSNRATLGCGTFVCAHACVGGSVSVGEHVIIGPGAIIGHDSNIGDFSILAPASCVGGAVDVGTSCFLGSRSVIRPMIRLADQTLVGMGAVVVHATHEAAVLVGNPARPLVRQVAPSI